MSLPPQPSQSGFDFDPPLSAADLMTTLATWTAAGWLRPLDLALARLLHEQDPQAAPEVLLLAALLAQREGRGHSCLRLGDLLRWRASDGVPDLDDERWLAGPVAADAELAALLRRLGHGEAHWLACLAASHAVTMLAAGSGPKTPSPPPLSHPGERGEIQTPLVFQYGRLYLRRYWADEQAVAAAVLQRGLAPAADASAPPAAQVRVWLDRLFRAAPAPGAEPDWQRIACALALRGRLAVITGGPGTGKTYTVARLLALTFALHPAPASLRMALAAPTGKAAARLKQSIDQALQQLQKALPDALDWSLLMQRLPPALTLHKLLGARPDTRRLQQHAGHPLEVDVLVVDEASMVHLEMMAALLQALPASARLVLLGDKDQLASVEAGAVLGDLCGDALPAYDAATRAWVEACTGERLVATPPVRTSSDAADALTEPSELTDLATPEAPALSQQTVVLRHSRRFQGAIGALARAVNAGDVAAARAVLRETSHVASPSGGASTGPVAWLTPARLDELLQLALHGSPPANAAPLPRPLSHEGRGEEAPLSHGEEVPRGPGLGSTPSPSMGEGRGEGDVRKSPALADDGLLACFAVLRARTDSLDVSDVNAAHSAHDADIRAVLARFERLRILCALREGDWGVAGVNARIEAALRARGLIPRSGEWYEGRPVMVTRNDSALGIFNGDVGLTLRGDGRSGTVDGNNNGSLRVWFNDGERLRSVLASRLPAVETAYAMTVHKSQGSEFEHTVLVLPPFANSVLTRELVYTGITRARSRFTLVTPEPAVFDSAVQRRTVRVSGLALRL